MAFGTWESYFYPETYDPDTGQGTLRNLFDERDPVLLRELEYAETMQRQRELLSGQITIPRTYDAAHVCAIHGYLFQDVYEWAGHYRGVNIFKNLSSFADVSTGQIDRYLADVRRLVESTDWASLDHESFARAGAEIFAYLNQAHPFREGNGRTSKVFMEHVAEQSRFTFAFERVTPQVWNQASMLSGPDLGGYEPVPDSLVPVFRALVQPRTASPATPPSPNTGRSAVRASFPQTAAQATSLSPQTEPRSGPQARYRGPHMPGRSGTGLEK